MKMEVLAVQQQYQTQYGWIGSNKVKDWTSTFTPPTGASSPPPSPQQQQKQQQQQQSSVPAATASLPLLPSPRHANAAKILENVQNQKIKNSINNNKNKNKYRTAEMNMSNNNNNSNERNLNMINNNNKSNIINKEQRNIMVVGGGGGAGSIASAAAAKPLNNNNYSSSSSQPSYHTPENNNLLYCDDIDTAAVDELSLRLLDELRAAKSRHLTCTEVSLPCDLTTRIAAEIIRVSEKEPCGIRGCTIYIEFEDEPNNSRRIASLKLDPETVSTFEVYLTLRQDHRGWTALLPQFIKSLARTITISPEFTITKHKLYTPHQSIYS